MFGGRSSATPLRRQSPANVRAWRRGEFEERFFDCVHAPAKTAGEAKSRANFAQNDGASVGARHMARCLASPTAKRDSSAASTRPQTPGERRERGTSLPSFVRAGGMRSE